LPRHRHLFAYATLVVHGTFEQVSYAGRARVSAGDLVVQPTLDTHGNLMPRGRGATIVRLPWPDVDGLGGVYSLPDADAVVRAAERDVFEAATLAQSQSARCVPRRSERDLPDALARALRDGVVDSLAAWAETACVARETVSRAFSAAYGVSARQFRAELRARAAWLDVVRTRAGLAGIAAARGFADQAHMTRAIHALTGRAPAAWRGDPRIHPLLRWRDDAQCR
jgi:AraC-like DNA-binding protein